MQMMEFWVCIFVYKRCKRQLHIIFKLEFSRIALIERLTRFDRGWEDFGKLN